MRFDSDVGKHGDTGRSEREALAAVLDGRANAAAVGAASWDVFVRSGEVPPGRLAPFWTSPPYSHCNFTAMPSLDRRSRTHGPRISARWTGRTPSTGASWSLRGCANGSARSSTDTADVFAAVEEQGIAARW